MCSGLTGATICAICVSFVEGPQKVMFDGPVLKSPSLHQLFGGVVGGVSDGEGAFLRG